MPVHQKTKQDAETETWKFLNNVTKQKFAQVLVKAKITVKDIKA